MKKRNIVILSLVVCILSACEFVIKNNRLEYQEPSLYIRGNVQYGSFNDSLYSTSSNFVFGQTHFFSDTTYMDKEDGVTKSAYITINNGDPLYLKNNTNSSFVCDIPVDKLPHHLDTLRLFASHSNFDEVATAYTIVPNKPIITVTNVTVRDEAVNVEFSLDFEERSRMHQFYVKLRPELYFDVMNPDSTIYTDHESLFEYNDMRLTLEDDDDIFSGFYDDNYRNYLYFLVQQITDKWGWPYNFKISFYKSSWLYKYEDFNKIVFKLDLCSYDAYMREKTNNYYSDMLFSEPVQTYNNVVNGKGCFGVVYTETFEYDSKSDK